MTGLHMTLIHKEIADGKAHVREERISILLDGDQREPTEQERALAEADAQGWERKAKGELL